MCRLCARQLAGFGASRTSLKAVAAYLVQDEHDLQGTCQAGVGPVGWVAVAVQHVQEVLSKAQALIGVCCLPPSGLVISQCCQCGDLHKAAAHTNQFVGLCMRNSREQKPKLQLDLRDRVCKAFACMHESMSCGKTRTSKAGPKTPWSYIWSPGITHGPSSPWVYATRQGNQAPPLLPPHPRYAPCLAHTHCNQLDVIPCGVVCCAAAI